MTTRTVERSDEWEAIPFSGGYAGLQELADQEFSGKVIAGPTRLFMLRGSVVGVLGGSIEDFEEMDGTAREAPHPALPLLAVMQERSEEVRAKYYSEDTPLSEVNRTLEDGSFTGYIELSENVLSGDYYQVYHQGRSMSVAWVGAAERLITDEDAFQQADDEVGIYSVHPADIEVVEIPEPAGAGAGTNAGAAAADPEATDAPTDAAVSDPGSAGTDATDTGSTGADATDTGAAETGAAETGVADADVADTDAADTGAATPDASRADANDSAVGAGSTATADDAGADDSPPGAESSPDPTTAEGSGGSVTSTVSDEGEAAAASGGAGSAGASDTTGRQPAESGPSTQPADDARQPREQASGSQTTTDHQPTQQGAGQGGAGQGHGRPSTPARTAGGSGDVAAGDLETRSLPSLDPDRTASGQRTGRGGGGATRQQHPAGASEQHHPGAPSGAAGQGGTQAGGEPERAPSSGDPAPQDAGSAQPAQPAEQGSDPGQEADAPSQQEPAPPEADAGAAPPEGAPAEATEPTSPEDADGRSPPHAETGAEETSTEETSAEEAVAEQVEQVEQLQSELGSLEGERDEIAEERDLMERQLEEAKQELERLRGRLDEAVGEARDAEVHLSPSQAVDETNLFVRYDSRGDATLENAHAGDADREDVDENLRLEYHTAFEADDAAVDGRPFDDFLTETIQYRFVDWLVRDLLYEIRDTGHGSSMADLYDALPRIDRVELNGIVTVTYVQNGDEHRSQEGFDIVVRDRMGNPLIVANINDSREPATDGMMTGLVTAGERVGESSDTLAGVFLVTKSFFEPESLETAEQATSGGLLSRDKRKSFVNLSRKGGYHLCLVEARNQEFHLTVPEL